MADRNLAAMAAALALASFSKTDPAKIDPSLFYGPRRSTISREERRKRTAAKKRAKRQRRRSP